MERISMDGHRGRQPHLLSAEVLAILFIVVTPVAIWTYREFRSRRAIDQQRDESALSTCRDRLLQINAGIALYAKTHDGHLPSSLADLLEARIVPDPYSFICPGGADEPARGTDMSGILQQFKTPGHCSFIYLVEQDS